MASLSHMRNFTGVLPFHHSPKSPGRRIGRVRLRAQGYVGTASRVHARLRWWRSVRAGGERACTEEITTPAPSETSAARYVAAGYIRRSRRVRRIRLAEPQPSPFGRVKRRVDW